MTNLELMICEAENDGEIDLDTIDQLLSFFTAPFTVFLGKYLMMSVLGFAAKTGVYSAYEKGKVSIKTANKTTKVVDIATEIQKTVMTVQAIIKSCKSKKESGGKITMSDFNIIKGAVLKSYDQYLSQLEQLKKYGHSIATDASKPTSESVLEEIYEVELCGDITPEERAALIDYMEE